MSLVKSALKGTCPGCRKGYLFESKNPYNLKKMFMMNQRCSHCQQSFSPEPRFYEGAMYVSYAFNVAIIITIFIAFNILFEYPNHWIMIMMAIGLAFVLSPLTFRLSRSVWIHLFVKYQKKN